METCNNCGRPLIPYGGKCVYCGTYINDAKKSIVPIRYKWMADFVFCLDCTCSMMPVLDSIKDNIVKFMEYVVEEGRVDWRARVMGYRNFEVDEEYLMNDNPFVTSVDELKVQLDGMKARGNAENEPCSTLDAIWYAAKKTEWRNEGTKKLVLVFTDASTKPVNEKTCEDIVEADFDLDCLQSALYYDHIRLYLWALEDSVYDCLQVIPYSKIIQFTDPIDFYYHKIIDMSYIYYRPDTTEEETDDDIL